MNCKIIIEKYNSIISKIKNKEEEIKLNSDSPLLNSYIKSDIQKLIIQKNKVESIIKLCNKLN